MAKMLLTRFNPYFFRDIADVTAHTMKYEYLSFKQKMYQILIYIYLLSAYLKFRIELQQDEKVCFINSDCFASKLLDCSSIHQRNAPPTMTMCFCTFFSLNDESMV